tara:strand:- start:761 stop:1348 length:588 start_codon:yes stop_codon:yes gene_type:complete
MNKPDVHMITMSENTISMHYRDYVLPSWKDAGYNVVEFEAIVPDDLSSLGRIIPLGDKTRRNKVVGFTDTEKAVWYSHYSTWMLCRKLNTPIIVIEHDILLEHNEIDSDVFNYDIACLSHVTRKNGDHAKLAGGAYYITPKGAKRLCAIKDHRDLITYNSDAWIHSQCDKYGKWFMMTTIQYQDPKIGVTVEHLK